MKKPWKWLRPRREPSAAADDARISLPQLERAIGSVEPAARLVLPRLLRRVVRLHTSLHGLGFRVPHSKTYVIPRTALLALIADFRADREEIGFGPTEELPERVILLERPNAEILDQWPRGEVLLYYWELLFHARVHEAFDCLAEQPHIEARLAALGSLEFDEIRNVLGQERFLLPPCDDASTYIEFAAVYLGIRYFQPFLMASFFPALESLEKVDAILALDIAAEEILDATRLPGTPQPEALREAARQAAEAFDADPLAAIPDFRGEAEARGGPRMGPAAGSDRSRSTSFGPRGQSGRPPAAIGRGPPSAAPGPSSGPRAIGPRKLPPRCGTRCMDWSSACKRPWASKTRSRGPGARPCWPWPTRRRGDCGRSRRGCSTTCRRSASIRCRRSPRST